MVDLWPDARCVKSPAHDGLVTVDVAVSDFEIKVTFRVSAYPSLVADGRSLAAEIG